MRAYVHVMIGLDCDRPRGVYLKSEAGSRMAETKIHSLEFISSKLDRLGIPRTYFICGQFLESMAAQFGKERLREAFSVGNPLVEVADHTYTHRLFKAIPTRPDKEVATPAEIIEEYDIDTEILRSILKLNLPTRGLRAPLGYYGGLRTESELLDVLSGHGISYISSDYRDGNSSINPPLLDQDGKPRQPYRYPNGLLEIPGHGWHDTVFGGHSTTAVSGPYPNSYSEIVGFYQQLFSSAWAVARSMERDIYLGLIMHPYNVALYDTPRRLFDDIGLIAQDLGLTFCQYQNARTVPD
jgi:peptidoglycan/xylan/chitin deacetylase (PgdA/CDA1 family)